MPNKKKKLATPVIDKSKKLKRKDAVAMGRVIGKNPLSDKVIASERKKKNRDIEKIFIKK
tara:strand:+ start:342 stop:521 length:180 start_codon:yes stop_codon:yes gene_type:complete